MGRRENRVNHNKPAVKPAEKPVKPVAVKPTEKKAWSKKK